MGKLITKSVLTLAVLLSTADVTRAVITPSPPELVAHAGGEINGFRYTNSLEALNKSYAAGFRFFEIDLEQTADGWIVLLHDWDYSIKHFYNARPKVYTLAQFKKLSLRNNLTPLSFRELAAWLRERTDAYIITDIKRRPVRLLRNISRVYPDLRERIIPQVYSLSEYAPVRNLGYPRLILTLYANSLPDTSVIAFAKKHPLWAITMSNDRARKTSLPARLNKLGIFTYAHLVDTPEQQAKLRALGIDGFYTAYLRPTLVAVGTLANTDE